MIDFERINREALSRFEILLPELLPGGRMVGREYCCSDLSGGLGDSLKVNIDNGKWADFADIVRGGDPVSLVAAVRRCGQGEAAGWLENWLGNDRPDPAPRQQKPTDTWKTTPAPAPPAAVHHPQHGNPDASWEYRDASGRLLGIVCRFHQPTPAGEKQRKEILPHTYGTDATGKSRWRWKSWQVPRPLYGLDRLAQLPDAPVLICEGEKDTDAAQRLLPNVVAVTWPGGSNAVVQADFSLLKGRRVAIWPDNDEPGHKAAEAVARAALAAGATEVYMVNLPPDKVEGWGLADAETEGWTAEKVSLWLKANRRCIGAEPLEAEQVPRGESVVEVGDVEWPEPTAIMYTAPPAPYPTEALPEIVREAVLEVTEFVQCPLALTACSALAVLSTAGQGLVDVRRAQNLEGPISLYLKAIADSGERKSTVDGFFSRPLREWENERREVMNPELQRFRAKYSAWEAKKAGLAAAIRDATKSGKDTFALEARLLEIEQDEPVAPRIPRLLVGDCTPEGLANVLAREWPATGILSAEAGTILGGHAMRSDSSMRNMALLNSLWSGEPLSVTRKAEGGSFALQGVRLTMGLAVQPATVRAFIDASKGLARGTGWLARFLVAWPESSQGSRMFTEAPEHWPRLARFHRMISSMLDQLVIDDTGKLSIGIMELHRDAKDEWVRFHDDVEAELAPGRDMAEARDVASKAADNAARLAALFALADGANQITVEHITGAAELVTWHMYEARRFMREMAAPANLDYAAKLDAWLVEQCKQRGVTEINVRETMQYGPNATRKKDAFDQASSELVDLCRIRIARVGKQKLVQVNPLLLEV